MRAKSNLFWINHYIPVGETPHIKVAIRHWLASGSRDSILWLFSMLNYMDITGGMDFTIRRWEGPQVDVSVVCVSVLRANNVILLTDNPILWSPGVCLTQVTDITTGQDCMEDWSGMASLVQLLLTLSLWENRYNWLRGILIKNHALFPSAIRHYFYVFVPLISTNPTLTGSTCTCGTCLLVIHLFREKHWWRQTTRSSILKGVHSMTWISVLTLPDQLETL